MLSNSPKIRRVILVGAATLSCAITLTAQSATSADRAFDDASLDALWAEFSRPYPANTSPITVVQKRLQATLNDACRVLHEHLLENERELQDMAEAREPRPHQPGEMDLFPLWEEIPEPVPSLPEAKAVDCNLRYGGFVKKVEMLQQQLADAHQKHNKYVSIHQREGNAGLEARARAEADRNPMVQQMGGATAVANMTESQRNVAAKQAVNATLSQNPTATGGGNLMAAAQAMAQLAATDASYRARIERMTEKEKFAELNRLMQPGETTVQPRDDTAFANTMEERDQALDAADVQRILGNVLVKMQQVGAQLTPVMLERNEVYATIYKKIDTWYARAFAALPVEAMGESLEKKGLRDLQQMRAMLTYAVNKDEAATRAWLWRLQKIGFKSALGEFNDFIGQFGWSDADSGNLFRGTYEQPQIAEAVNSVYRDMIRLTKEAELFTRQNKGRQEQYEIAMR